MILGAITLLVFFTGEPAEEAIEQLPGFSEAVMERHEEASVFALVALLAVSALSLAGLVLRRQAFVRWAGYWRLLLASVLLTAGIMGWVANFGGKIRHTEIAAANSATLLYFLS